jgi:hypothetical protein
MDEASKVKEVGEVKTTWKRVACWIGVAVALCGGGGPARGADAVEQDPGGFLYGTIETRSGGRYTGLIRWDTEEAFWDDLFHGAKEDLPHLKQRKKERRSRITVFGVTVGYRWDEETTGRLLVARFGDIREIRPRGAEDAELVMKSGSSIEVDGGSNDLGARVVVLDVQLGEVALDWEKIDRIAFGPAPRGVALPAWRLHGTVHAAGQTFEGPVQWDMQESLSSDKLDGESDDGELSIAMGQIRRIERRSSSSSRVVLTDGRELVLRGTNDVDESNRGICVEDPRYGRVAISWDAFESLELGPSRSSGRGYADYPALGKLRGTVTDREGKTHAGELVFDLDEQESWEILNGSRDGIDYDIPFALVRSIEPDRWDSSRVVLRGGAELLLEDGQDVSEVNAGVLVLSGDDEETFVAWQDVRRIAFD